MYFNNENIVIEKNRKIVPKIDFIFFIPKYISDTQSNARFVVITVKYVFNH